MICFSYFYITAVSAKDGMNITAATTTITITTPPTLEVTPIETFSLSSPTGASPTITENNPTETITDTSTIELTPTDEITPIQTVTDVPTQTVSGTSNDTPSGFQMSMESEPLSGYSINKIQNFQDNNTNTIEDTGITNITDDWFNINPDRILTSGIYNLLVDNFTLSENGFNIMGNGINISGSLNQLTDVTTDYNQYGSGIYSSGDTNSFSNINSSHNYMYGIKSEDNSTTFSSINSNNNRGRGILSFGNITTFSSMNSGYNGGNGTEIYGSSNILSNVSSYYNEGSGIFLGNDSKSNYKTENNILLNVTGNGNQWSGIRIDGSDNQFSNLTDNNNNIGIWLNSGINNTFNRVTTNYNRFEGVLLDDSGNRFFSITSNNNGVNGVNISGNLNQLTDVASNNNTEYGIYSLASYSRLSNVTSGNNRGLAGIFSNGASNTFSYINSSNNWFGINSEGGNNTFSSINSSYNIFNGTEINGNSNIISDNDIQNNGQHGLVVHLQSNNNKISHNIFKNNRNNPSDNVNVSDSDTNIWNDTTGGNYYGYNGQGFSEICNNTDNNEICDEPFTVNANNIDYKPLTTQNITPTPTTTATVNTSVPINPYYNHQSSGSYESGSSDESHNTQPYSGILTSSEVPGYAQPGQSTQISFTYQNKSEFGWSAYDKVGLLVHLKDANGNVVETITIPVPEGVTIEPGQSYTFTKDIPIPSTPGTYILTATLEHMGGNTPLTFGQQFQQTINVETGGKTMNSFHKPTMISTLIRLTPTPVSLYYPTQYPRVTPYMKIFN